MNKKNFPFVALSLGLLTMLVVMKGVQTRADGSTSIPLLTLLVVSEFAFFVTAIGGYLGIRQIRASGMRPLYTGITLFCILLSVGFLLLGIRLWPN
ncbi:MAG: hypothetical protein B6D72_09110 [gamma proteobacterium symbiont of Ctena orbiculata]|uniref:Uncharacterized protein n=1 Tax=Candidatus Thiodiazotropha taylori TaxID=2792791 RepID=A0A944M8F1_9GAMM|nr:hypothetical protein [Candidatus Thiodiazotropha taylori]PUB82480.1 MAG: hypothetical protein DBP00_17535 [gamma proteobacterium symbiont of Ctena orbiculata]MBT2989316.1 hypothetical protein [Candidatus Thiodiazotropha taylori]MBT2996896.1 hypothetical protein [Candidatus Thiodiazotropha taylori]MBT3000751.1 hypothetical protein [Candidatus Thiodiazotropha taylori]